MKCAECNKLRNQIKRLESQSLGLRVGPEEAIRFYCRARVRVRDQILRCYAVWMAIAPCPAERPPANPVSGRSGKLVRDSPRFTPPA